MSMKRIAELVMMAAAQPKPVGQVEWTTPGTYSWVVPDNVYSISPVAVGAGGAGGQSIGGASASNGRAGSGGGLRYAVAVPVTPGETLTIIVGAGGPGRAIGTTSAASVGGDTRIQRNGVDILWSQGGQATAGGAGMAIGGNIGGGNGGIGPSSANAGNAGGGGAGGYAGNGGGGSSTTSGNSGTGGAGGGGGANDSSTLGGRGGSVGIRGQGASGVGGAFGTGASGRDGSAESGPVAGAGTGSGTGQAGGLTTQNGRDGAVRIIYGEGRAYPSTRTADE